MNLDDRELVGTPRNGKHYGSMTPIQDTMNQEDRACRTLWIAVIHRAMIDLVSDTGDEIDTVGAKAWFFFHSNSFNFICSMAGLDPEIVRARARVILKNPTLLGNPHV